MGGITCATKHSPHRQPWHLGKRHALNPPRGSSPQSDWCMCVSANVLTASFARACLLLKSKRGGQFSTLSLPLYYLLSAACGPTHPWPLKWPPWPPLPSRNLDQLGPKPDILWLRPTSWPEPLPPWDTLKAHADFEPLSCWSLCHQRHQTYP